MFNKEKVKINFTQGSYWLVPSIFTFSKRKWVSHPFHDLDTLISKNNWTFSAITIDLNGDENFIHYNKCQKVRGLEKFLITEKIIQAISENQFFDFYYSDYVTVRLDKKSIRLIQQGKFFCYPEFYFEMVSKTKKKADEKVILIWRKNDFEELKNS